MPRIGLIGAAPPQTPYQAGDMGMVAWAYDPAVAVNNSAATNGTLFLVRVKLRGSVPITNLAIGIATGATTATANQNFLGFYDSAGTRVATTAAGALDVPSETSGFKSIALSAPYAAPAGDYWIGILMNAATPAALVRASGASLAISNAGLVAASMRFAANGTALTALPATITPGSNTTIGAVTFWAGAS